MARVLPLCMKKMEVCTMKKIILPVIAQFVVVGGLLSPKFVSGVAAQELTVKTSNGVSYLSGGFGEDERERLRSITGADNLELSFALHNKEYLGGANVLIKDAKGNTVLEALSDGPLFFAKLPAGSYSVQATAMGKTLKQTVQVPSKGHARVYFAWNAPDEATTQVMAQK
jgi:hypothetical protein